MENSLNDKPFWAAYLNMANHNAYLCIKHITDVMSSRATSKSGWGEPKEGALADAEVIKCLKQNTKNAIDKQQVLKLLHKHLPFLSVMLQYNEENEGKGKYDKKDRSKQL